MQNITMNGFQLSPQQENLWLRQPQSAALRAQCAVLLAGKPDAASLQHALRQVVRRHEILRTTFHRRPGMKFPFQVVDDAQTPFTWREVDLSGHAEPEQQERSAEVFRQDGQEAFDLECGPLVRATLLVLSADRRRLVLTLPAICSDAWSLKNLVRELGLLCGPSAPGE